MEDVSEAHLQSLCEMVKIDPFEGTVKEIVEQAGQGLAQIWEMGQTVVVTQTLKHPNGLELFICGFNGPAREVCKTYLALHKEAKAHGIRWIGGEVGNRKIGTIAKRLGSKVISERFIQEV